MFADKKIVTVIPERLGDALICTPALHYLKHCYPTALIDIIALSDLSAEVFKHNPDIHRVLILPQQKMLDTLKSHYDFALNIHDSLLARKYIQTLNIPSEQIKHIDPPNPNLHQAEQALQFIQSLIPNPPPIANRRYQLHPDTEAIANAEQLLEAHHVDFKKDILIGLQPGCHSLAKKSFAFLKKMTHPKIWPFDAIVDLGHRLYQANPHLKIVITGSKSEKILGKKLSKLLPNIVNLIDQTTVLQLAALMRHLKLFISPDTGVMHVACSSDVPLIALIGPTQIKRTGPYPPNLSHLTIIQAPTMAEITADKVFQAISQKLHPLS